MGNIETTTKFSRLQSNSSVEDNYYFTLVNCLFSLQLQRKTINLYLLYRKCSLKLDLKSGYLLHRKPFKDDEKCFQLHLKSSFCSRNIEVFVIIF